MIGRRGLTRGLGSLAVGLLSVAAVQAAEGEFMRDAMSSIGLIEREKAPITYNERAPLAMPPALGRTPKPAKAARPAPRNAEKGLDTSLPLPVPLPLPPPQTRADDPQWPKDPEIRQRERAALDARKPIVRGAQGRMNDNNETLSIDEIQGGRRAGAGFSSEPAGRPGETRESTWLDPLKMFSGRKEEEGPSPIEPERDGLTDPPTGYRKAPIKVEKAQGGPVGSFNDNQEADPRAYMRAQSAR